MKTYKIDTRLQELQKEFEENDNCCCNTVSNFYEMEILKSLEKNWDDKADSLNMVLGCIQALNVLKETYQQIL